MENKEIVNAENKEVQSTSPAEMVKILIGQGIKPEDLDKMLTLQERWDANQARKAYHEAMSAFKASAPEITKDKNVSYKEVKYSHASLHNVTSTINKALSEHGLSASWNIAQNGAVTVTCKITHVMGHSEETSLTAPSDTTGSKNSIQAIGSTISYLERYSLLALTGLSTGDQDDDGQGSEPDNFITEKQANEICDMIDNYDINLKKFLTWLKVDAIDKIPSSSYKKAIDALKSKAGEK